MRCIHVSSPVIIIVIVELVEVVVVMFGHIRVVVDLVVDIVSGGDVAR